MRPSCHTYSSAQLRLFWMPVTPPLHLELTAMSPQVFLAEGLLPSTSGCQPYPLALRLKILNLFWEACMYEVLLTEMAGFL